MNIKTLFLFIFICTLFFSKNTSGESVSFALGKSHTVTVFSDSSLSIFNHLSIKEIEKRAGRTLKFKEKVAIKFFKANPSLFKQFTDSTEEKKLEKKALWSKWLGIGSLIGLFVPGVNILSLPAAIIAIVFGANTVDKVKDKRNSRQGITFGIITLGVILLLVALVVIIIASLGVR